MKQSSNKKVKDSENRIKELEGVMGRKQLRIDYLKKLIDIAKEELDLDIKKTAPPHNQLVPKTPKTNKFFDE